VVAITGNKLAPSFGDHYLARTGYSAQQYDGPEDPDRPNNLWEPVPGDRGARGDFDRRAHAFSSFVWGDLHRGWLAAAALGVAGLVLWSAGANRPKLLKTFGKLAA